MKRFLTILLVIALGTVSMNAQTKAETSLYNKTMKKPSLKAYDKFLAKFPSSSYSLEILSLRDRALFENVNQEDAAAVEAFAAEHKDSPISDVVAAVIERHNTSPFSAEEALEILRQSVPEASFASGFRRANVDYVYGIKLEARVLSLVSRRLSEEGWGSLEEKPLEHYTLDASLTGCTMLSGPETVKVGARNLISFSYLNSSADSRNLEFVSALYDPASETLTNAMFFGRNMSRSLEGFKIEGQSPEAAMAAGLMLPENVYLLNLINSDSRLEPISKPNALTDDSIKWWIEKNPTAETKATRLNFGALDEESSLVEGFKKARSKDKDSSSSFTAALFDIRDYTVIVAYSKTYKNYFLVWCEPVCRDKNRDKLLNTIYFEDASTLDLFYYKGKTTFKIRVNLASKAVRR